MKGKRLSNSRKDLAAMQEGARSLEERDPAIGGVAMDGSWALESRKDSEWQRVERKTGPGTKYKVWRAAPEPSWLFPHFPSLPTLPPSCCRNWKAFPTWAWRGGSTWSSACGRGK